jgi:hypothetical protein
LAQPQVNGPGKAEIYHTKAACSEPGCCPTDFFFLFLFDFFGSFFRLNFGQEAAVKAAEGKVLRRIQDKQG